MFLFQTIKNLHSLKHDLHIGGFSRKYYNASKKDSGAVRKFFESYFVVISSGKFPKKHFIFLNIIDFYYIIQRF